VILIDGRPQAHISVLDRGLAYGDGVFRTMLARAGAVRSWPRHFHKLHADCLALDIECPAEGVLAADMREILRVEPDCVLKIIVTRGCGGRGYAPPFAPESTRIVAAFPLPRLRPDAVTVGVRVRWCSTRLSIQPALAGVKHLCRLENVLARAEWTDPGIAEGLMLDTEGRVIEGTMSNLFLLERGQWVTPDLSGCGVAGVQRDRLMALLAASGASCAVERIAPARVMAADLLLLVNSVIGVWWISRLEERHWQPGDLVGPIAQRLEQGDD
jgi:4-amino-4-deoxychorismate lyase